MADFGGDCFSSEGKPSLRIWSTQSFTFGMLMPRMLPLSLMKDWEPWKSGRQSKR